MWCPALLSVIHFILNDSSVPSLQREPSLWLWKTAPLPLVFTAFYFSKFCSTLHTHTNTHTSDPQNEGGAQI